MIYCISDIHGEYDSWLKMLEKIGFSEQDTMYIIGDAVDRGPKPLTLLKDILSRPNVVMLAGNHELSAVLLLKYLIYGGRKQDLSDRTMLDILLWQSDGGSSTLAEFRQLSVMERTDIVAALTELELHAEVRAGGRGYILVHAGLGSADSFDPSKALDDYDIEDLLFTRMDYTGTYFKDKYLVTGHTPVRLIRRELSLLHEDDSILHIGNHIAIDCGCTFGGKLGCLCLDNGKEYYI